MVRASGEGGAGDGGGGGEGLNAEDAEVTQRAQSGEA